VSKRHQNSRRKSYGRRQHELRERTERQHAPQASDFGYDDFGASSPADAFAYVDPRSARLRYGYID